VAAGNVADISDVHAVSKMLATSPTITNNRININIDLLLSHQRWWQRQAVRDVERLWTHAT
jgi:hypothetical protein